VWALELPAEALHRHSNQRGDLLQPGRLLNDFPQLGFNQAENGKKVFDGHMNWIAAGDGINMNYRFSQPGRTERNRQDHLYVEGVFPFANVRTTDPITGKALQAARCRAKNRGGTPCQHPEAEWSLPTARRPQYRPENS
jgi:hypothetical protein